MKEEYSFNTITVKFLSGTTPGNLTSTAATNRVKIRMNNEFSKRGSFRLYCWWPMKIILAF